MLSTRVKSIADLMSIALQAEREAVRRYAGLAADMREGGNTAAAALFERMVAEEQEHERLLLEWMARESIDENPAIGPIRWRDPEAAPGRYDDEARNPHYSTPYRALAFAVNNEEIAFRFYTHVAAEAKDENLRRYAETLAREELAHAALLRAERRLAYHAERKTGPAGPRLDPEAIHNEAQLLAIAIEIDRRLLRAMREIDNELPRLEILARDALKQIRDNETALQQLAAQDAEPDATPSGVDFSQLEFGAEDSLASKLGRLEVYCDRCFVLYDSIVETARDESVLQTAQRLAASALDRIGVIKEPG